MTLSTLIPRIEQAGVDEQRELLDEVWNIVARSRGFAWAAENARSFVRKLDAQAYLDAAMMLKPEGWGLDLKLPSANKCVEAITGKLPVGAILHHMTFPSAVGVAETPAMALLAAICRATVKEGEDGR